MQEPSFESAKIPLESLRIVSLRIVSLIGVFLSPVLLNFLQYVVLGKFTATYSRGIFMVYVTAF